VDALERLLRNHPIAESVLGSFQLLGDAAESFFHLVSEAHRLSSYSYGREFVEN
jgi:hypothetical protein